MEITSIEIALILVFALVITSFIIYFKLLAKYNELVIKIFSEVVK